MEGFGARIGQHYIVECYDMYKVFKWREEFSNLVVVTGCVRYLGVTLSGAPLSGSWYIGLKGTGTPVSGDTMASHASWADMSLYTGTRPAWSPTNWGVAATPGTITNSGSVAVFTITTSGNVFGAFMCDSNTLTGATGTLLGVGDFTGGSRTVQIGDTLNVTVAVSITG